MKKIILSLIVSAFCIPVFALNPVREYAVTPDEYGIEYEEKKITTEDGVSLNAWWFKPQNKSGAKAIIIADDGDGNMADNIELITKFTSLGYHVLAFDYRGYGKSDDFKINPKMICYPQFEKDVKAVMDHVKKNHASMSSNLYGKGIGASLLLAAAANRTDVRKVIADTPFLKLESYKAVVKAKKGEDLIVPIGYNKFFMEPFFALTEKGSHLYGILLISGEKDDVITPDDMKELTKLQKNITQYKMIKGVGAADTYNTDKDAYFGLLQTFLEAK
ncbi:MAG: hypothetical protein POELPBGB_03660 [Bacteroidia bacterium]|nr:hypothetical protein [Bacteroidia bacterium]